MIKKRKTNKKPGITRKPQTAKLAKIIKENIYSLIIGVIVIFILLAALISNISNGPQLQKKQNKKTGVSSKPENFYTVQEGDDLYHIAVKQYGNGELWPTIAVANGLVSPDFVSKGSRLRIPR